MKTKKICENCVFYANRSYMGITASICGKTFACVEAHFKCGCGKFEKKVEPKNK